MVLKFIAVFSVLNFLIDLGLSFFMGQEEHLLTVFLDSLVFSSAALPLILFMVVYPLQKRINEAHIIKEELHKVIAEKTSITEAASDAIITMDAKGLITSWNTAATAIFGYKKEEALGKNLHRIICPERFYSRYLMGFKKLQEDGWGAGLSNKTFEMVGVDNMGREFPIEISLATMKTEEGWSSVGVIRDVEDRKIRENEIANLLKEKELLLKEVHHRIKNNMNIIVSLLSLQMSTLKDEEAVNALADACSRVHSMTILYEKLYHSADYSSIPLKDYLESIMDEFSHSFNVTGRLDIEKDFDDIILDIKTTQSLGIVVNELLTNIIKYAYNNGEHKIIGVSAKEKDGMITLVVRDNGKGMPEGIDFKTTKGFGLMLVGSLTDQLKGEITIERGQGTKITIIFPHPGQQGEL